MDYTCGPIFSALGHIDQIDALLLPGQSRVAFIRAAVEKALAEAEKARKPRPKR